MNTIKKAALVSCVVFYSLTATASDSLKNRSSRHIIGLQANSLIRQIFNPSGSSLNPYLLTYTIKRNKAKWGIDMGMGYTLNSIFDNDGTTKRESNINEIYFRGGLLREIPIHRRLVSVFSVHALLDIINNQTLAETKFGGQSSVVKSSLQSLRYGVGPTLGFRYRFHPRFLVGTEASYNYRMGTTRNTVENATIIDGQEHNSSKNEIKNDLKQFLFAPPTAIYILVQL